MWPVVLDDGPASVTRKPPEAVCEMVSGVTKPVANWVVAAEPAVARSAEASTPRINNFESRSLIALPSEEVGRALQRRENDKRQKDVLAAQQTPAAAGTARGRRASREPRTVTTRCP